MTPYYADDWLTVYLGDCRAVMAELDPESVQTVVTSPPYWGLRDYGVDGQLGLEATPDAFVAAMVDVFREVRRVLRSDGTVWLNLGDSYASSPPGNGKGFTPETTGLHGGRNSARYQATMDSGAGTKRNTVVGTLKPKDRLLMPARVALALQADGWWLRDEIVWHKPNPMPSSVRDRTTPAHEMVYLLSKSARYHYDAAAIAEPVSENTHSRVKAPRGWDIEPGAHGTIHRNGRTSATYREAALPGNVAAATERQRVGLNARWDASEADGTAPQTRNRRSVWTIATQPYPEAHYATFPEALVEPMILAGCPEGGTVLDPFAGSGTVGLVAQRLSRRAVLIDLSSEYLDQAFRRNHAVPLGLTS